MSQVTEALKPCPFCGHAESLTIHSYFEGHTVVHCDGCGADGPADGNDGAKSWNIRMTAASPPVEQSEERFAGAGKGITPPPVTASVEEVAQTWAVPLRHEIIDECADRLRELAEKRPSDGVIERQRITEDAITYGQAVLFAAADELAALKEGHSLSTVSGVAK